MKINLRMEIFDAMADDDEGIEEIKGFINYFYGTVTNRKEILTEIEKLLAEKLIYIAYHDEEEDYNWYAMTPEGWATWKAFDWDNYNEDVKSLRIDE